MEMYNTLTGLPSNAAQWALLQSMAQQGLPYGNQIYNMMQSQAAMGLPYANQAAGALGMAGMTGAGLMNFIGGLQGGLGYGGGGGITGVPSNPGGAYAGNVMAGQMGPVYGAGGYIYPPGGSAGSAAAAPRLTNMQGPAGIPGLPRITGALPAGTTVSGDYNSGQAGSLPANMGDYGASLRGMAERMTGSSGGRPGVGAGWAQGAAGAAGAFGQGGAGGGGGYSGPGGPLMNYLESTRRSGLTYAPQQEAILQAMSDMGAFRSAVLPEVQDVMRGLGRTGYTSGSMADRTISDTLGSLYNKWQWNALQGYQNLGNQMQAFQNNLTGGYGTYGGILNQAEANRVARDVGLGANAVGMANVEAKRAGDQLQALTSAYGTLGNLGLNTAAGWGNLGNSMWNVGQGNISNLGQLSSNTANYNQNLLAGYGNYNAGLVNQMPQWYQPYNSMLGYTSSY